jgi:lipoyl-dependent peroxiredoxin
MIEHELQFTDKRMRTMAVRTAEARWEGTLKEGNGKVKLGSGAFEGQYNFNSRFEEGVGTNPEELIGAAHAGCFTMALNVSLERAGTTPTYVQTSAKVHITKEEAGMTISKIELVTEGAVPGLTQEQFADAAQKTLEACIVSRALSAVPMTVEATLK